MIDYFKINIGSEADIVILEYRIKKFLKKNFFELNKVFLIARELATNVLKYGTKGYIEIILQSDKIVITAIDYGIKRKDLKKLNMEKGLGLGLKVIKNNSDEFFMVKNKYGGMTATSVINFIRNSKKSFVLQYGISIKPHYLENKSGDTALIREVARGKYLLLIADVLGHGSKANIIAEKISDYFSNTFYTNLEKFYLGLSRGIMNTRGCALLLALITEYGLEYINVGNIKGWIISNHKIKKIIQTPGVVGRNNIRYKIHKESTIMYGTTLIACTDGIASKFSPSLFRNKDLQDVQNISDYIIKNFGIKEDDATVVVVRGG